MTKANLSIDQGKLFAACNHDTRLMALVLALTELTTGDRVEIKFASPQTDEYIRHYHRQFVEALGISG
jgi:hypothetical protein